MDFFYFNILLLTASDNLLPESDLVLRNMFICFVIPDFPTISTEVLPPVEECIDLLPLPDPPVPLDPVPALEPPVPPLLILQ